MNKNQTETETQILHVDNGGAQLDTNSEMYQSRWEPLPLRSMLKSLCISGQQL